MVKFNFAHALTASNAVSGIVSILFTLEGNNKAAVVFLFLCVIFDMADGTVARIQKTAGPIGKELDSLADIISFGIAPIIFGSQFITGISRVSLLFFVVCAMARLAKFNVTEFKGYYVGMPTTLNGIIIPFLYLIGVPITAVAFTILGLAMISPFKIKKVSL